MRDQIASISKTGLGAGVTPGIGVYDEQIRQNIALFDQAMKMFTPFAYPAAKTEPEAPPAAPPPASAPADDGLTELRKRMEEMQAQIEKLASKS